MADESYKETLIKITKDLEKVLRSSPTTVDIIAYRGQEYKYVKHWEIGKVYEIDCFWSTTLDMRVAEKFAAHALNSPDGAVLIEIRLPKGTEGLYVGAQTAYKEEDCFLLNRGLKLKVISSALKGEFIYLVTEGVVKDD